MLTILLCALFFGLDLNGLTVTGLVEYLSAHPFLTVMLLGEIFNYRVTISK